MNTHSPPFLKEKTEKMCPFKANFYVEERPAATNTRKKGARELRGG
jgi:hypothetical protein